MAEASILNAHEEYARYGADGGRGSDALEGGARGLGGGIDGAADPSIGIARGDHQSRLIQGPAGDFGGFDLGHALRAAALQVQRSIFRGVDCGGVNENRVDQTFL